MDDRAYWVGFNLVKGIGSVRLQAIQSFFSDLSIAWQAPREALLEAGLSPRIVDNLIQIRKSVDLARIWDQIHAKGIRVLIREDEDYPARLREIDQPPPVIYIRGDFQDSDFWSVAMVGTRRVTAYGRQVAEDFSTHLARNGITIVSGLARGVDAIAHQAAVDAGGRTLAVLGSGVDRIYPPEHARLAEQIIRQGALISDYFPGTAPDSQNFPPRNRIISGLSLGVIIIEAGETSGALITASFAAQQGRDVLAVPGNIIAPQSKGTNRLIQQGAHPLLCPQDIYEFLNLQDHHEQQAARKVLPADEIETQILKVLRYEPLHIDEIQAQSGLPIDKVSATLAIMELKGLVRQTGGMSYTAVHENQAIYGMESTNE